MLITTLAAAAALALGPAPAAAATTAAPAPAPAARVAQQDPADSAYRAAQARFADGDYKEAAAAFAKLREKYPKSGYADDALYWRAYALFRAGGTDELRAARESLATLRKEQSTAYRGDAAALDTRICGQLARRGDQRCAATVSDIASAVDAVVAMAADAASTGIEAAASAMSSAEVRAAIADAAAAASGAANEGARIAADQLRDAAESMRGMRADMRMDARGRRTSQDCSDSDDDERVIALNALMQMDAERAMPLLKKVMARRDKCSEILRRKAVFLVAQKRTDEAADILVEAARNDPDQEVREQSVYWLSRVSGPKSLNFLRDVATKPGNTDVRKKAVFALSSMSDPAARATLRDIAATSGGDREVREEAIQWLGQRGSAEDLAWLRENYSRLDSEDLKEKVMYAMSRQRGNEKWLLDRALDEKESIEVRKQALFWAGQRKEVPLDQLFALYDRVSDREMKQQLIYVYSRRPESQAVDRMITIAKNEKDKELRSTAVQWLGRSKDPRAIEFLVSLIDK